MGQQETSLKTVIKVALHPLSKARMKTIMKTHQNPEHSASPVHPPLPPGLCGAALLRRSGCPFETNGNSHPAPSLRPDPAMDIALRRNRSSNPNPCHSNFGFPTEATSGRHGLLPYSRPAHSRNTSSIPQRVAPGIGEPQHSLHVLQRISDLDLESCKVGQTPVPRASR